MAFAPRHYNGHLMCAIDVGTSGPDVGVNEILEVAVVPLAYDYTPSQDFPFFDMKIKPMNGWAEKRESRYPGMAKEKYIDHMQNGVEPVIAAELFTNWFEQLRKMGLGWNKRLVPISFNYAAVDRPFLIEWLGPRNYEYIFQPNYRDGFQVQLFINDLNDHLGHYVDMPMMGLGSLATRLGVGFSYGQRSAGSGNQLTTRSLDDALLHAECYRLLIKKAALLSRGVDLGSAVEESEKLDIDIRRAALKSISDFDLGDK